MKNLFTNENRKYCKLTSDEMFYAVYGADTKDSNRALMALINTVLDRKDDPIVKITIKNPISKDRRKRTKDSVLDIRATADSGEQIDCEMENAPQNFYSNRSVYYGGKLIVTSLKKGEKYVNMRKSIVISFVNGIMFNDLEQCHCVFQPRERAEGILMSDKIEWHYIQLGRVDGSKDPSQLNSVEKLAAYLRYAHDEEMEDYLKKLIDTTEVVSVTEEVFEKMTEEEIAAELRESQERFEHDIASRIGEAEDKIAEQVTKRVTEQVTERVTKQVTKQVTTKVTAETEERMSLLVSKLLAAKRYEDLERVTEDAEFRHRLYTELNL